MTVSIALCSYNGATYIGDQLRSILAQSVLPSEIVIGDDLSTDDTVALVHEVAENSTVPIVLTQNASRLGVSRNFEATIGRCSGEIIFTCDQDDLWDPIKIETTLAAFTSDARAQLVFTDADIVDADGVPTGQSLWESIGFDSSRREMFRSGSQVEVLYQEHIATGAAMAFRRELCDVALPFPAPFLLRPNGNPVIHDGWLALVAAATSSVAFVEDRLIRYRKHAGQQIGPPESSPTIVDAPSPTVGSSFHIWTLRALLEISERHRQAGHNMESNDILSIVARYGSASLEQTSDYTLGLESQLAVAADCCRHLNQVLDRRIYRIATRIQRSVDHVLHRTAESNG